MGEKRGMKALEVWCKRVTEGYKDVNIENMGSSWRDGLAFCALIHHFHPELIDFETLSKENILQNNQLAFSVAEKHLGIPALLEAEDMVKYKVPDKLSIMTYVSQFYQCFQGNGRTISPSSATKRSLETDKSSTPSPESPPAKLHDSPSSLPRRHDVCQTCKQRVYILERLIIDSKLYHRTCFKCCRCKSVLKPGSYVEGRSPGEYECVSCPDEEEAEKAAVASMAANRVARQTSPSESWQPLRPRQPMLLDNLKLSTSVAEARKSFLNNSVSLNALEKSDKKTNFNVESDERPKSDMSPNEQESCGTDGKSESAITDITDSAEQSPAVITEITVITEPSRAAIEIEKTVPLPSAPLALPEDIASNKSPVPSPRARRKKKSVELDTQKATDYDVTTDDVFSTPSSSPIPDQRRIKESERKESIEEKNLSVKPVAAIRHSKSLELRSDAATPSRVGLVIHDMPVIRSSVSSQDILSPVRKENQNDIFKSSRETSLTPPPKPKRLSAQSGERTPSPHPSLSEDIENKDDEIDGSKVNLRVHSEEKVQSWSTKKVPPPRPQLPVFLKPSPRSSVVSLTSGKSEKEYPDDLNPFGDEEEEQTKTVKEVTLNKSAENKSLNPFDSEEDDKEASTAEAVSEASPVVTPVKKREPPAGSNPFGSDDDDEEYESSVEQSSLDQSTISYEGKNEKPLPLPRKSLDSKSTDVSPAGSMSKNTGYKYRTAYSADTSPAGSIGKASGSNYSPFTSPKSTISETSKRRTSRDSGLDISPTGSISKGLRKKRPAPLPPGPPFVASPRLSHKPSPRSLKKSPAPPPPPPPKIMETSCSSITSDEITEKAMKELDNLTLKSSGSDTAGNDQLSSPSPSKESVKPINTTFGYWKKKKPAPPVPLPPKRQITKLPMEEIQKELKNIEEKQLEMERRGVELEKLIRDTNLQEADDSVDGENVDDAVLQLFDLVNQKNSLFRRQAELVYLRRQQRLEEEHAELEFQIRCLMNKPENTKMDEDRELEDELIARLMEVVRQRNEIIESMETDRLREAVEDQSIQYQMTLHQASSSRSLLSSSSSNSVDTHVKKEKKKKKDKIKKGKVKEKTKDVDEDKDLDETETVEVKEKAKKEKKRKWF